MRVLNCLHRSHLGGAQRRVVWVATCLRQHDIETIILFPKDQEMAYEELLRKQELPYMRMRFPYLRSWRQIFTNLWFLLTFPQSVFRVMQVISREQIDVVHINGVTNLQPLCAALLCRKPVIWHLNDMLTPKSFVRLVSPLFRHPLVHVIVASQAIVSHYAQEGLSASKWRILPAPFFPYIPQARRSQEIKQSLGLTERDRVLGFVGNLVPLKGVLDFLAVAEFFMARDANLHAVIVGAAFHSQADYSRKVKARVRSSPLQERFHLVGYQEDVPAWLDIFDILIFPSYSEACPIVVLEAMNAGLPLVATRVGEIPLMLENTNIPLVDAGDVTGLISGADQMLKLSSQEKKLMSNQLKQKVKANYSLEVVVTKHKLLYEEVVKEARIGNSQF